MNMASGSSHGSSCNYCILDKVLTRWCNARLAHAHTRIGELSELSKSKKLLALLESLSNKEIGCLTRRRWFNTISKKKNEIKAALKFMEKESIQTKPWVRAEAIVRGDLKCIESLVWSLVLHYQIKPAVSCLGLPSLHPPQHSPTLSSEEGGKEEGGKEEGKEGEEEEEEEEEISLCRKFKAFLLTKILSQSRQHTPMENFASCCKGGPFLLALVKALLHPTSVSPDHTGGGPSLEGSGDDDDESVSQALHLAEQRLGVPEILLPSELSSSELDERSVLVYLSYIVALTSGRHGHHHLGHHHLHGGAGNISNAYQGMVRTSTGQKIFYFKFGIVNNFILLKVHGPSIQSHVNEGNMDDFIRVFSKKNTFVSFFLVAFGVSEEDVGCEAYAFVGEKGVIAKQIGRALDEVMEKLKQLFPDRKVAATDFKAANSSSITMRIHGPQAKTCVGADAIQSIESVVKKKFAGKTIRVSPEDTEVPVRYHHSSGPFQSGVWIETLISFELDSPLIIKEMKDALDNVREIVNQHFQSKDISTVFYTVFKD